MRVADINDTLPLVRVVEERLYGRGARPAGLEARAIGRSVPENVTEIYHSLHRRQ
jgi:hypothetical protein